jgi:1-acyl-sn-glycerol-3-phosphate acyltransferase
MKPLSYYWRLFGTGFSFSIFGLGAVLITVTLFPIIHLLSFSRRRANRGCQYVVHLSFRFFIWMMKVLGVLTHDIVGAEKLIDGAGNLIVANHPTLLDIVFLVSLLPSALCLVKKSAGKNPFFAGLLWATGYILNDHPMDLITACVQSVEQENNLLIFPEGTRSVPSQPMKLKRVAAAIIAQTRRKFVPVIVTCEPPSLSKVKKWYEIPGRKMHFKITVGDTVDPRLLIIEGEQRSKTNRRINAVLRELFLAGIEEHERAG